jgi:hypothetical protein
VFEELLRVLPGIRLVPGCEPEFAPGYFTRTLQELWVEFTPPANQRQIRREIVHPGCGRSSC